MTDREELDSVKRMLGDACSDLGAIHEALGLDHDEAGGAAPILEAIERLQVLARNLTPKGWKLVPIEPTQDMWVVGFEAVGDFHRTDEYQAMAGCRGSAESAKVCYRAMLREAPKPVGCDAASAGASSGPSGDRFEFEHAGTTHTLFGERAAINALIQWRKRLEKITNNALANVRTGAK